MIETIYHSKIPIVHLFHCEELYKLIKKTWDEDELLILCPPHVKNTAFIQNLKIPKNIVLGVFTSGTLTGKPRLILYSKKNIASSLNNIKNLFDFSRITQIFCYPQPTHTFGLTLGYIFSILYSIPLIFHEGPYTKKSHEQWLEHINAGTLTLGTPTHFIDLMNWISENNKTVKTSYSAIIGGAPVSIKLWKQIQTLLKVEQPSIGYGATEASPGIMHLPPGVIPTCDSSIGYLLPGINLSQLSEQGFAFSGENVCEYIADENGLTPQTEILIKDRIQLTHKEGQYQFNGRADLVINRGGIKLSPELIENYLLNELHLKCICVGYYSERLSEDIGILIHSPEEILTNNSNPDLSNQIKNQILEILKNKFYLNLNEDDLFMCEIPINSNGKWDRNESLKTVIRLKKINIPINISYLTSFLPHRSSAIWIHRIVDFGFRYGHAEVDLDLNSNLFTGSLLRETACIELVAQTYGYSVAAFNIFSNTKDTSAEKTLIAEVRNSSFNFDTNNQTIIKSCLELSVPLTITATCTHDFGPIKVISGEVFVIEPNKTEKIVLATVNLKAFVSS